MNKKFVTAAVMGGAIAGVLDIGAAAAANGLGLDVIMRAIARGVLGPAAMKGGTEAAALGFALQVFMGALIGLIYGVAATRLPALIKRWIPFGMAYGVGIFLVMNYVVVPLSAVGKAPTFKSTEAMGTHLGIMIAFGLFVAAAASLGAKRALAPQLADA
jgi:hypothetical protein